MTFKVAVIEFSHESNTFTVHKTGIDAFCSSRYFRKSEVVERMRDTASEMAGAIDFAEQNGWELVPILAAHANPGGPVTEDARQEITDDANQILAKSGPFDGVFIALHGSMVTESDQDGESQFLRVVREVVGWDTPIAITLDLHANIFNETSRLVNIAVSYRTYPHVDMRERAAEACDLLHQTMVQAIAPRVVVARPPMLVGCDDGRTTNNGPMCRILALADLEMQHPDILNVAINAGFTDADVAAAGPNVLVTYDGASGTANAVATRLCEEIWRFRNEWSTPLSLDDCMAHLSKHRPSGKPTIVADFSDNPGSGAYGDCTAILGAMLKAGLQNVALGAICDAEAAAALATAGLGATTTLKLGGKTDASVGGGPLELTGTVTAISDGDITFEGPMLAGVHGQLGVSVCFRVAGIDVLVASKPLQMHDQNAFRCVGIEPAEKCIVVVKSMQHFRAAFEPISHEVLVVDAGGLCSPNVALRDYKNLRRPVFPLDEIDA